MQRSAPCCLGGLSKQSWTFKHAASKVLCRLCHIQRWVGKARFHTHRHVETIHLYIFIRLQVQFSILRSDNTVFMMCFGNPCLGLGKNPVLAENSCFSHRKGNWKLSWGLLKNTQPCHVYQCWNVVSDCGPLLGSSLAYNSTAIISTIRSYMYNQNMNTDVLVPPQQINPKFVHNKEQNLLERLPWNLLTILCYLRR